MSTVQSTHLRALADLWHVQVRLGMVKYLPWLVCKGCTEAVAILSPVKANAGPALVQVNLEEREIEQLRGQV